MCFNLVEIWYTVLIGGLKANTSIKFGILSDFMHKTKSNFCQTYSVHHFKEQVDVARGVVRQYCLHLCTRNLLAYFIMQVPGQHV